MPATIFTCVPVLLSLVLYSGVYIICGAQKEYLEVDLHAQMPASICSSSHKDGSSGNAMKVTHRYGPCSSVGGGTPSELLLRKVLDDDRPWVDSLQQRLLPNSSLSAHPQQQEGSQVSVPARSGLALGSGNYVVTVRLGTPRRPQTVIFDTGSNLNWVQCKPCVDCHRQKDPIFDPAASTTYHNLSCSSTPCSLLGGSACISKSCAYFVAYGDGSVSSGYLSQDALTLAASDVFRQFVFGCGNSNTGLFGTEAGLFGLSRSPLSLISQTSNKYGRVFSYCLPSLPSSTGDLELGPVSGNISYTPMITNPRAPSLYFLKLTGISVGEQLLRIPPKVFSGEGTLIDSGTVITRLPKTAYKRLRAAFRKGMKRYKRVQPVSLLDTCYDLTGMRKVLVPAVALHFDGGVRVPLAFRGIMFVVNVSRACLAFAGNSGNEGLGVIGNTQQASLRVVYDLGRSRIGFGKGSIC